MTWPGEISSERQGWHQMIDPPQRAVVYARYSNEKLQKESSIADQLSLARTYAQQQGVSIVREYADKGRTSATMLGRPELMQLMQDAKAHKFDVVIVESLDRLSRDQADIHAINRQLTFHRVEIRTPGEGIATSIHVGLRGIVGEMFLKDLGNKVRRHHTGRALEGKIPGRVAYGYRAIPGKPGEREIDAPTAAVVRRIFAEYAAEKGVKAICDDLNREGIPAQTGKSWNYASLNGGPRALLTNRLYVGELHWNNWTNIRNPDTGKVNKRRVPDKDRVVVRVPHLRIVDQAVFDAAEALRLRRAAQLNIPAYETRQPWARKATLLMDLVRCESCGAKMVRCNRARNGSARIMCYEARRNGACDHTKTYDMARLEAAVLDGLHEQLAHPEALADFVAEYHKERTTLERAARREKNDVQGELADIEASMMRLVTALEKGTLPEDMIVPKLQALEVRRAGLKERRRLAEDRTNVVELHPRAVEVYREAIATLHQHLQDGTLTPQATAAFRNLVERVVVKPTPKRAPYQFRLYGHLEALLGIDLFPAMRTVSAIAAEAGSAVPLDSTSTPQIRAQRNSIRLGDWTERRAA